MKILATDKKLRDEKANAAYKRSLDFSWEKTAKETLKAYERTLLG